MNEKEKNFNKVASTLDAGEGGPVTSRAGKKTVSGGFGLSSVMFEEEMDSYEIRSVFIGVN